MRRSKKLKRRMAGRSILLLLNVFQHFCYVNCCCNLAWHRWTCCCAAETSSQRATCPTWPAWPALTSTRRCARSTSIIGLYNKGWTVSLDSYVPVMLIYHFSGEAIAPLLTIFIGGNHEATNYLQVQKIPKD